MAEPDVGELLRVLDRHRVDYIVIGAQAAVIHGVPVITEDLDVTPAGDPANLARLAKALAELDPRIRTASEPKGVPFRVEAELLATAETWNLTTRVGELDLAFRPAGTGGYDDLRRNATAFELADGLVVQVASLADVIRFEGGSRTGEGSGSVTAHAPNARGDSGARRGPSTHDLTPHPYDLVERRCTIASAGRAGIARQRSNRRLRRPPARRPSRLPRGDRRPQAARSPLEEGGLRGGEAWIGRGS